MNNWRILAEHHWQKFLPQYYRSLQKQSILEETLDQAAQNMTQALVTMVSDQGIDYSTAREILLPQYILLAPEAQTISPQQNRATTA